MDTASADGASNEECVRMMDEMVSTENVLLKLVSESADKMGSEEVYDEQVLDLCKCSCCVDRWILCLKHLTSRRLFPLKTQMIH